MGSYEGSTQVPLQFAVAVTGFRGFSGFQLQKLVGPREAVA